jgi:hypothetical protein
VSSQITNTKAWCTSEYASDPSVSDSTAYKFGAIYGNISTGNVRTYYDATGDGFYQSSRNYATPAALNDPNALNWNTSVYLSYTSAFTANITNDPSTKAMSTLAASSTYYAYGSAPSNPVTDGECTFTLTNSGSTAKINIHGHSFTGGVGWTLTSGSPGENTVRLTAYQTGTNPASGVVLTTSDQTFIASLTGAGAHTHWDYKLETGTFTDGVEKTGVITLTAVAP